MSMRGLGFSGGSKFERFDYHIPDTPTDGGAVLNTVLDRMNDEHDGGTILIEEHIIVDDQNVLTPDVDTDIIIQGRGRRMFSSSTANIRQCRSLIEFQGTYRWTNNLANWNRGKLWLRDLGVFFNACITNTPMINTEWCPTSGYNSIFYESGNTVTDYNDAIIGETTGQTPDGAWYSFENCVFSMKSTNCYGLSVKPEQTRLAGVNFAFGGTDQKGMALRDVETTQIDSLYYWLDENAEGCKVLELVNQDKRATINTIVGSSQAGAGSTTPNMLFGVRAGQTWNNTEMNYIVAGSIRGATITWGTTPNAPIYLWENADAQERTTFVAGSMFGDLLVKPPPHTFICDGTYETVVPGGGGSPGQPFAVNTARDVDLTQVTQARVSGRGLGDQAGGAKGIVVYNIDDAAVICTSGDWAGAAVNQFVGAWTNVTVNGVRNCNAYGYSDNGGETMSAGSVELQLR